ncbi:MAG: FtsX-like permease family protein [Actinomycetota bacterium]
MLKATLKSFRGHIGRTVATALAVILGISFLAGTLIFTDSVGKAFDDLFATVFETTDAQVRSSEVIDAGFGIQVRSRIDESLVDDVLAVDGVAAVDGFVQGTATVIGSDGEAIGNPGQGPPTLGFSWTEDDELDQFVVTDGVEPTGPGQVVLDDFTAETGEFAVGDEVRILGAAGSEVFELVGIARFGDSGSLGGATSALFQLDEAQRFLDTGDQLDAIAVRGDEGLTQQELVDRIAAAVGSDAEVITGEEATEEAQSAIASGLSFFTIFLTAFAVIAIFVSSFVIANTFSILIAQRTRELALFRALGASQGQVMNSVFLEAIVIGLVGSALGIGLGVGLSFLLRAGLDAIGVDLPSAGLVILPRTIIVCLILGLIVTVASAMFPAIRASRISPMQALRESSAETWQRNNVRFIIGLVILGLGGAAILYGLLAPEISFAGLGAGIMFIGVFVLGPSIARPVARVLGSPISGLGTTGKLARDNSMRNPKRTARTAAALTIGVALVAGVTVLNSSLRTSIEETVAESFVGDIVVNAGGGGPGSGFSPELTAAISQLEEIEVATALRFGVVEFDGDGDFLIIFDPETGFDFFDVGLVEGDVANLDNDAIFLLDSRAEDLGVGVGDEVTVGLPGIGEVDLEVGGIYDDAAVAGNQVVSTGLYETTGVEQLDVQAYAQLADGVSVEEGRAAVEALTAAYPNTEVQDRAEFVESQTGQLDAILGLILGLLGLAVIIAAFGIANTLRLSTIERTREIGLLRAVGMSRGQVQRTIILESIITAVFGAVLGIILGLFFGYAIIYALRDQGVNSFSVPGLALLLVLVLGAVVGLVASIVPAIRASRLNILEAIAT